MSATLIDMKTRQRTVLWDEPARAAPITIAYDPYYRERLLRLRRLCDIGLELDAISRRADALIAGVDLRPSDTEPAA